MDFVYIYEAEVVSCDEDRTKKDSIRPRTPRRIGNGEQEANETPYNLGTSS